jgi:uncharacterized membrane protein YecN with MAPEG domain
MFPITALYASALAILMIALMVHVILHRARTHVSLGHGEDGKLHEAIRRHGNMVETVPMALILMALAEAGGMAAGWLHLAGGLLLAGRIIHPFGLTVANPASVLRIAGVSASWIAMLIPIVFVARRAVGL